MKVYNHPEQMTPGSCWKVKGMRGLKYLEKEDVIGYHFYNWSPPVKLNPKTGRWTPIPVPELQFDTKSIFMLVSFKESPNGLIDAAFLKGEKFIKLTIYQSFWDKAFRLVYWTTTPREIEENKLLFGKYDVNELRKKLELDKDD